jgi:hypothetical protein
MVDTGIAVSNVNSAVERTTSQFPASSFERALTL